MNLNNENQIPSFIPNSGPTSSCSHSKPCHHGTTYNPSPCNHHRRHHAQTSGQCHMHSQYDMQCHACNTPLTQIATTSYQHCQCYRCQRSRREPVLHPAVGIPLAIATGGLSCAAMGIYRGVTLSRRAKKLRQGQHLGLNSSEGANVSTMEKEQIENAGYAVPSSISAARSSSSSPSSNVSELEDASTLGRRRSVSVSEIDGSPVEVAPPRYSEVMGMEVRRGPGEEM